MQSHWPPCGCLTATSGQWPLRWMVQRKTILIMAESSLRQCCPKVLEPSITNVLRGPATHSLSLPTVSRHFGDVGSTLPPGLLLRLSLPGLQGGVPNCPLASRKTDRLGNRSSPLIPRQGPSSFLHNSLWGREGTVPSSPSLPSSVFLGPQHLRCRPSL